MVFLQFGGGRWICRGADRTLLVAPGADKQLGFAAFACRDADGLDVLRSRAESEGVAIEASPSPYFEDGAFAVRDPDDFKSAIRQKLLLEIAGGPGGLSPAGAMPAQAAPLSDCLIGEKLRRQLWQD